MANQVKVKKLVSIKDEILKNSLIKIAKGTNRVIFNDSLNRSSAELIIEEDATCIYITFDQGKQATFSNVVARLKKNATLHMYNIVTSNQNASINVKVDLEEANANVDIINLVLLINQASLDSFIDIYHHVDHTTSNLSNYAIAKDEAVITLNNNATIKKHAFSSVAHQQTKGLTLSKKTKIIALPNLYIDEYDVVANHACAIGSISKEDLFYLMSRGLTEQDASKIVVMGYVKPILDHITDEKIKKDVEEAFAEKLLS